MDHAWLHVLTGCSLAGLMLRKPWIRVWEDAQGYIQYETLGSKADARKGRARSSRMSPLWSGDQSSRRQPQKWKCAHQQDGHMMQKLCKKTLKKITRSLSQRVNSDMLANPDILNTIPPKHRICWNVQGDG